jgi:hypothetical protein
MTGYASARRRSTRGRASWSAGSSARGWHPRTREYEKAREQVAGIRLLSGREMRMLFPRATLYRERLFGLTKSYVAHGASSVETAAATSP